MTDRYKLLFRGEVLEGQHQAVVRKRLAAAAGFDDAALEKLFSGRLVVVKRDADAGAAARFQALFRKAGARLRVVPVEADGATSTAAIHRPAEASFPSSAPEAAAPPGPGEFELLPAGSDVLRAEERTPWQPREIDTGGLTLERARFELADSEAADAGAGEGTIASVGPDASGLTLAERGTDLGPRRPEPDHPVQAPDLEVAGVGADLGPRKEPVAPRRPLDEVQFDVAPAGADLGQRRPLSPPPVPDTSHLTLE